jgi:proteasome accessory factor C
MSESALDRTARALDLIPYLLEHQGISITELATVFGVTEKQINEDLILIHMCGLPGYTPLELIEMYYEDGFVTVSDPQSLKRPRKMTRSEVAAMLVSLDMMKSLQDTQLVAEIEGLQNKIRNGLQMEIPYVVISDTLTSPFVKVIEVAIMKSQALAIEYLSGSKDERSLRNIAPLELYVANSQIYLVAWCEKSGADRTFRVDRILACSVIEQGSLIPRPKRNQSMVGDNQVVLVVDHAARSFVEENQNIIQSIEQNERGYSAVLYPVDEEWLIRTIIGYGNKIRVEWPPAMAESIQVRVEAISQIYLDI